MEELLRADGQRDVVLAGGHGQPGEMEGGGGRCTGVLDVEDRNAEQAGVPQRCLAANHLLAGDEPGHRVGEVGGLHVLDLDAGVHERLGHGLLGERAHAALEKLPEPRHSDTGDDDVVGHDDSSFGYFLSW